MKKLKKQVKTTKMLVLMLLLGVFVVLASVSSVSAASTVYVNTTGSDSSGNGSAENPYQTIGKGINSVEDNGIVRIADGNYSGAGNTGLIIDRSMTIVGQSQKKTVINGTGTNFIFGVAALNVTIANLTFTNATSDWGGAISNSGTNLNILNCTFTDNTAQDSGGAISNSGTNLNVINCTFTDNTAQYDGGGAIRNRGTDLNILNCTFTDNTAQYDGGAILNIGTNLNILNCTFTDNTAQNGGAILNRGTNLNVLNCTFTGNTAQYDGGAILNRGTNLNVLNCTFTDNTAQNGGAIRNDMHHTMGSVSGCTFTGNTAQDYGGAIYNEYTMGSVSGCTFIGNIAYNGGAIFNNWDTNVSGCTFTGNTANNGGGAIFNYGYMYADYNWWGSNDGPADGQVIGCRCNTWLCMNIIANPDSIVYNEPSTVIVSFNNTNDRSNIPNGVYIPDGTVTIFGSNSGIFNSTTVFTHNGIAAVIFTGTNIGTNSINATTDSQTVLESINVIQASTTLTVDNVTGVNGKTVDLTATLKDGNNHLVSGKIVTFNVSGVNYNRTTDANGVATLSYPISETAGFYTITASFTDDPNYIDSSNTGTLTVNTIPTTLTVNNATNYNGQTVNLTATLKDKNGNPLTGKTVTFNINGSKYTAVTDLNGIATLNYKLSQAGVYTINASFVNGTIYANSTENGTLTVKPSANLYINTKNSKSNPNVGETSLLTYKLGNYGPDEATNVTVTFQIPEGLEFVNVTADTGKYTYNPTTRTVTWTIDSVPVGDPYLYLTVKAASKGTYQIAPKITSDTYNQNSKYNGNITIKVQSKSNNSNNGNSKNNSSINGTSNNRTTVNAASKITKTVGLQDTGLPLNYLLLAVLMVFGGLIPKRR